jgi:hypothetical protein
MFETPPLLTTDIASCWPSPEEPGYAVAASTRWALLKLHSNDAPAVKLLLEQTLRVLDRLTLK